MFILGKKIKKIDSIKTDVKATVEFEGLTVSDEALIVGEDYLMDKISGEDAIEEIKSRYQIEW